MKAWTRTARSSSGVVQPGSGSAMHGGWRAPAGSGVTDAR